MTKPSFLIIGAQRSGTTSLRLYLSSHPNVVSPRRKEVDFFTDRYSKSLCWYSDQLGKCCPGAIHFDKSPNYLPSPDAPERVAHHFPDVKLIALLRNPVDRAWSQHRLLHKLRLENRPFFTALKNTLPDQSPWNSYLWRGHYAEQLERWFEHIDRKQFCIVKAEDFFDETHHTYQVILEFLGLKPHRVKYSVHGAVKGTKSVPMRGWLEDYYRPHNERLYELLGTDMEW